MGEPAMAANMEADIRLKFFVALGLSLLIVLLSPMGKLPSLLPIALPTAVRSWTLFLLATPVVFWSGSMFILGALLVLKPGDRVPVDGKITEGQTALDEALVTGESLPVEKKAGDSVIAGSINGSGSISFTATGVGADTTLTRIAKLV